MKINVITTGFRYSNVRAFIYPLIKFNNFFRQNGLIFNLTKKFDTNCNIIFLESNVFGNKYHQDFTYISNHLLDLKKKVKKVIYFDTSDSTSLLHPKLLDYVDLYCKSQVYSEVKNYTKKYYGNRIFTDYCSRNFNVKDKNESFSEIVKNRNNLKKIKLFWNSGVLNHSLLGKIFSHLYHYIPIKSFLFPPQISKIKKDKDLFYLMTTDYTRNTVSWHRERAFEVLKIPTPDRKNILSYFNLLSKSKICISPFGWGEINYRDFESVIYGSVLLKPDMNHLITWPNIYNYYSVINYNWSCTDLKKKIEKILSNYDHYSEYAQKSKFDYINLLKSKNLRKEILKIVNNIIN